MLFIHNVYVFSSFSRIGSVFYFMVMLCFCLVITECVKPFWFSLRCDRMYLNLNFSDLDLI